MVASIFFWTVVTIGMTMFPLVTLVFKGSFRAGFIKGCVFGFNYSSSIHVDPENEDSVFEIHGLSFYVFFFSIVMAFSLKRDDLEVTDDGD